MDVALKEARAAGIRGEVPVGAVIVGPEGVIAQASNRTREMNDPTAHAEVMAIRQAAEKLKSGDLSHCKLYVSSEPTMMGKALILSVGIPVVYYGLSHDEIKSLRMSEEKVRRELHAQEQTATKYEQLGHEEAMDMFQNWIKSRADKTAS